MLSENSDYLEQKNNMIQCSDSDSLDYSEDSAPLFEPDLKPIVIPKTESCIRALSENDVVNFMDDFRNVEKINKSSGQLHDISIIIKTNGGDLCLAETIVDIILGYPGKVKIFIDGIVSSIGTVIALTGHEIFIRSHARIGQICIPENKHMIDRIIGLIGKISNKRSWSLIFRDRIMDYFLEHNHMYKKLYGVSDLSHIWRGLHVSGFETNANEKING